MSCVRCGSEFRDVLQGDCLRWPLLNWHGLKPKPVQPAPVPKPELQPEGPPKIPG